MHLPTLISDLALILFCAATMSLLFKKLNQPVVLGYIVAGFLAGPYMPFTDTIVEAESISTWAEIGVIFIMFSLGLEFSFKKLLKIGSTPIIATILILVGMILIGIGVGAAFQWGGMDGLYLGGMIAMSSTSIIIKALDDLGLRQQKFTSTVFSVLILEDIIAIIMMILFGTLGKGDGSVDGNAIFSSLLSMVFYLVLWFVAGIYLIPTLLKKTKKYLNNETLLIVSLALCFLMVIAASFAGFSAAFGAFVMGSILAETNEGAHIDRIISPVKDLFGAIFFVSVGMMINPEMLVKYWLPILVVTLVVLVLRSIVSALSFMAGGLNVRTSIECAMSLAPVGEFSFIIAALGISLGAISGFIYPIIVSVSVITTFLTPAMIKLAKPLADKIEPMVPAKFRLELARNESASDNSRLNKQWRFILKESAVVILVYTVLSVAVIELAYRTLYPYATTLIPDEWAKIATLTITLIALLAFIRPIVTKGLYDENYWKLWHDRQFNRAPLVFISVFRVLVGVTLVTSTIHKLYSSPWVVLGGTALFALTMWIMSRQLSKSQTHMENVFWENFNSKEDDTKKQHYAKELTSRNLHLSEIELPKDSIWCGKSIRTSNWGHLYGVHIASIIRETGRINIPSPDTQMFPGDKIQLIGTDENLTKFADELKKTENLTKSKETDSNNTMEMVRVAIPKDSVFNGRRIAESNIRNDFHCMIVGIDRGLENLIRPLPDVEILSGDLLWVVGETADIKNLQLKANEVVAAHS